MNRRLLIVFTRCVPILWSCAKTYTYQSYEVVRSLDKVSPGEDVKLVKTDGELIQGTVVQVDGKVLTVATFDKGRKKIVWDEVKILERVKKAFVVVH